jgi:DHA3 family macrolide efflux protein-like MFS transporter
MHSQHAANWKPHFLALWIGQALSLFGSSLVQFALVWWLTRTTGSAVVLTTATLAAMLPGVVLAPVAGVLVDRWNRRVVMIVADSVVTGAILVLAYLFAINRVEVWHVYVIMFVRSAAQTFQNPAMTASTSLMVPEQHLARVAGFNQALNGGMNIVAPPVGALLLAVLPMNGVLLVDVATAVLGIVPLFFIFIPQPARAATPAGQAGPSMAADLRAGLRYVLGWPGLLVVLGMALVINFLFAPAASLIPLLVTEHFGGGAPELAALDAVFGLGVIGGGLVLGVWGGFRRRVLTSLAGLVGLGSGFVLLGATPADAFWLALVAAAIAAVMQAFTNGPLMAIMQAAVAPEMQGRVFSLVGAGASAMAPLGLLIGGPVADALGVRAWYFIAGGTCALIGVLCFFIPAVLTLEDQAGVRAAPVAVATGD